jgi:nitroreductase
MLGADALDVLFRTARTRNGWADTPVPEATLVALYDLVKMGPTSANCQPARFLFVTSAAARERLASMVLPGNAGKVRAAPVTAIIGFDLDFPERLPELFPHTDARSWFRGNDALVRETAFRNSAMQAGYFVLAARALGLDCGPMSGFDKAAVDAEFWAGTRVETNLLCAIGHGTEDGLFERGPRLPFGDAARIL